MAKLTFFDFFNTTKYYYELKYNTCVYFLNSKLIELQKKIPIANDGEIKYYLKSFFLNIGNFR